MHIKSFLFSVLVGMVACTNTNEVACIDTTQTQSKPEEVNAYYIPISEARADLEGIFSIVIQAFNFGNKACYALISTTGYYPSGIFDTTQSPAFTRSQDVNTEESSDKDGNFQYNLRAIINIRK